MTPEVLMACCIVLWAIVVSIEIYIEERTG